MYMCACVLPYYCMVQCSMIFFHSASLSLSLSLFLPQPPIYVMHNTILLFTTGDEIQNFNELIQAVKEIGNWRGLCSNLGVGQEVMDPLIHSTDVVDTKKMECLRTYFDGGEAKWSKVVKAVAMHPINNKHVALKIAEAHGLNFHKTVEDKC